MIATEFLENISHAISDIDDEEKIIKFLARVYLSFDYDLEKVTKRINFYFHDDTFIIVKDVKDKIEELERMIHG